MRDFGDNFFPALSMPNKIKLITSCATELIKLAKMTDRQANLDCTKDMLNTCQNCDKLSDKNYFKNLTLCSLKLSKVNLFFLFHLSIFLKYFYLFINLSFVFQFLFNIQIQFYTIFSAQHKYVN